MKKLKHEDLLFPEKRPSCPRCGSHHIQSRGMEWRCVDCRRAWAKEIKESVKRRIRDREK